MTLATQADSATAERCRQTPTLCVFDNRGLQVRTVRYNRSAPVDTPDEQIISQTWSARGDLTASMDARLFTRQQSQPETSVTPNFRYLSSLSGRTLVVHSLDAGECQSLSDAEGGLVWQYQARGQTRKCHYDSTLHRLMAVELSENTGPSRICERFVYVDKEAASGSNLHGRLKEVWSETGRISIPAYALNGNPLKVQQRFLHDDRLSDSNWSGSDWKEGEEERWANQLATDTHTTCWTYNALSQQVGRLDAAGNRLRFHFNLMRQPVGQDLQPAGSATDLWQPLRKQVIYSAAGQLLREVAGNDVTTDYIYEPQTLRLAERRTTRPEQTGRSTQLQMLSYRYDPVGNILAIADGAQSVRYTHNQRVAPEKGYTYDALYQLTQASGREKATAPLSMPDELGSVDDSTLTNYTRTYRYDRGGNLTSLTHQGIYPWSQTMQVADNSNRATPQEWSSENHFDECGNLSQVRPGQRIAWNSRNQLWNMTLAVHEDGAKDEESYWYDHTGMRAIKLNVTRTGNTTRRAWVYYLPGLEIRRTDQLADSKTGASIVEALQVLIPEVSGQQSVRILRWMQGQPAEIDNNQQRYSLNDHLGSSGLELDAQANILTQEEYYPYGATALWLPRSETQGRYKYLRYSGQERDASGLCYYGFRYYAPWLQRWINPDPAGPIDGLNLFCMVGNNPVCRKDIGGLAREDIEMTNLLSSGRASSSGRYGSVASRSARSSIYNPGGRATMQSYHNPLYDLEEGENAAAAAPSRLSQIGSAARQGATVVKRGLESLINRITPANTPERRVYEEMELFSIGDEGDEFSQVLAEATAVDTTLFSIGEDEQERLIPESAAHSALRAQNVSYSAVQAREALNPRTLYSSGRGESIQMSALTQLNMPETPITTSTQTPSVETPGRVRASGPAAYFDVNNSAIFFNIAGVTSDRSSSDTTPLSGIADFTTLSFPDSGNPGLTFSLSYYWIYAVWMAMFQPVRQLFPGV